MPIYGLHTVEMTHQTCGLGDSTFLLQLLHTAMYHGTEFIHLYLRLADLYLYPKKTQ